MKNFTLLFFILLTSFVFSQEQNDVTYRITSNPNNVDLLAYQTALNKSNFECFRYQSKSRFLTFKTGVVIELYSYDKVINAGIEQKKGCYLHDETIAYDYELDLFGDQITIKAPYDKNIKRVDHEK